MPRLNPSRRSGLMLTSAALIACQPVLAQKAPPLVANPTLEEQFRDPPNSARPRVWWHWMNGNVTKDGIAKDIAWMKRVGIGGLQNFDANLNTPQIVERRLVYMHPEWKDAFHFAAAEADRQGLELAIAASPGWSETGGPWVKPEDGLKKLVWSETEVAGGKRVIAKLAVPPSITGPFQSIPMGKSAAALGGASDAPPPVHYEDVAVLAYPIVLAPRLAVPIVRDGGGAVLNGDALMDNDLQSAVEVGSPPGSVPVLLLDYPAPETVRSATLFLPGSAALFFGSSFAPKLEASNDGRTWRTVADLPAYQVPATVAFAPVTARHFRVSFGRREGGVPALLSGMSPGLDTAAMASMFAGLAPKSALRVAEFQLFSSDQIDKFEPKAGFEVLSDYYSLDRSDLPEVKGVDPAKVIDLTSHLNSDGTLDWRPPAGRWRILRLGYSLLGTTNHPATPEATGLEVDKFDGAAVRRYLEHYISLYRDAAGPDLIGDRGVRAILTDSIEVGAANWTPRMVAQFKRLRGYDLTPWLPALTGTIIGSRAESDKFLYDYRRTLADLMASEHYETVATVAHENGLTVYGEALEGGRPSLGDDMSMRRFADIPMSAMWTHSREAGPSRAHVVDMRGAASVAHVYGQNLVAAESMTSAMAFWDHAPAYLKRIIDLEFVNGVNRPVIHTSVHQPVDDKVPGLSLAIFGQFFNRHESWAELAKPWVDYISRNALMLQQGRNVADVGYFYGEEAPLTGLYQDKAVPDAPRDYAYDFISSDALGEALANDGGDLVTPGGARYRVLYLGGSSRRMTVPTLRKLAALVEGGATVVGIKPESDPSRADDATDFAALTSKLWHGDELTQVGKGRVIASNDIEAALAEAGIAPDFRYTGGQSGAAIPFVHRRLADGDSYFLVNQKDRSETIEAHFRVTGKAPEIWHAETGTSEPLSYRSEAGETIVPLTLAPDESVHVVFRKPASATSLTISKLAPVEVGKVDGPWKVAFEADRGAPAAATFDSLAPLNENANPGVRYFSGIATYTDQFTTPKGWRSGQPLWIDLGEAKEIAEVTINGQLAGYAWHAPYRVDIGKVVRPGRNALQIRVANLWVNRLIGDAQPGATKITWTAMPTYRADAPLRRSGLIGPVTIWGEH